MSTHECALKTAVTIKSKAALMTAATIKSKAALPHLLVVASLVEYIAFWQKKAGIQRGFEYRKHKYQTFLCLLSVWQEPDGGCFLSNVRPSCLLFKRYVTRPLCLVESHKLDAA